VIALPRFGLAGAQRAAGTLAMVSAFCAAAVSGQLGTPVVATFAIGAGAAIVFGERAAGKGPGAWTALLAVALGAESFLVVTGRVDVVLAAAQFAVLLSLHRLWNRRTERDETVLLLLSLLVLCAGAALSAELLFGVCFLLYAVAATWALALTHLRFEVERARGTEQARGALRSGRLRAPLLLAALAGLALLGIAGSAVLFFAFPRLSVGTLRRPVRGDQPAAGLSDRVDLSRTGTIADDPRVVLRVRLSPPLRNPGRELPIHWRARTLEVWTGTGWRARGQTALGIVTAPQIPPIRRLAIGRRGAPPSTADIEAVGGFSDGIVLVPDGWPLVIDFPRPYGSHGPRARVVRTRAGDVFYWPADGNDARYVITYDPTQLSPDDLRNRGRDYPPELSVDLQVPADMDLRLRALSNRLARGKDPVDAALAIERWLSAAMTYTRDLPGEHQDPIAHFLFESRQGHCELFSSAMVMLLRQAGIPARVVSGYYGGTPTDEGYWAVRAGDAHSWVEMYVPGAGFVPFDPTPPSERGARLDRFWARLVLAWDGLGQRWRKAIVEFDVIAQARAVAQVARALSEVGRRLRGTGRSKVDAGGAALRGLAGLIVAFAAIALWRRWPFGRSRRAGLAPDERRGRDLWRLARRRLARAGVPASDTAGPREIARAAIRARPAVSAPLHRLVDAALAARWGGEQLSGRDARRLLRELDASLATSADHAGRTA
jgi:protein-glutamine gamma-glutamyltransferase